MNESCKHPSFTYEEVNATGTDMKIGIVRCAICKVAVGTFFPKLLDKLDAISNAISWIPNR